MRGGLGLLLCMAAGCGGGGDTLLRDGRAPVRPASPTCGPAGCAPAPPRADDRVPAGPLHPLVPRVEADRCTSACSPGCIASDDPTQPVWSHALGADVRLDWRALADREGNVYWKEIGAAHCELVSAAPDGTLRFRAASPCNEGAGYDRDALLRGERLVAMQNRRLVAHDARDGSIAWTHEVTDPPTCAGTLQTMGASDDALFVVTGLRCAERRGFGLLVLDLVTGAVRARLDLGLDDFIVPDALVVADASTGYVRYGLDPRGTTHVDHLFAIDGRGNELWRVTEVVEIDPESEDEDDLLEPVALAGGRLFVRGASGLQVREAATGQLLHELPAQPTEYTGPANGSWSLTRDGRRTYVVTDGLDLLAFDAAAQAWTRDVCGDFGICITPISLLTDANTLLQWGTNDDFARGTSTGVLVEIDPGGGVLRSCALARGVGDASVLHRGVFVSPGAGGIAAWRVPGLSEAPGGWSSGGGGPERGGKPR